MKGKMWVLFLVLILSGCSVNHQFLAYDTFKDTEFIYEAKVDEVTKLQSLDFEFKEIKMKEEYGKKYLTYRVDLKNPYGKPFKIYAEQFGLTLDERYISRASIFEMAGKEYQEYVIEAGEQISIQITLQMSHVSDNLVIGYQSKNEVVYLFVTQP